MNAFSSCIRDRFLIIIEECDFNGECISHIQKAIEKDTERQVILYHDVKKKSTSSTISW